MKSNLHKYLLGITGIFLIAGLLILGSASSVLGQKNFHDSFYYIKHQLLYGILPGILLFFIFSNIDYRYFKKLALPIFLLSVGLLILVFVPGIGLVSSGAKRWIDAGFFSFQPSEILKLSFIVYLAAWIESKKKLVRNWQTGFIPFLFFLTLIGTALIFQPDIGTLTIIMLTALLIYFLGGAKYSHLALIILTSLVSFLFLVKISPYRFNRILSFLNPEIDPLGISYQINQALLAIGSGGIFGVGFGESRQKYNYLPQIIGDSIFAVIAEELGFIGISLIIILFLIFIYLGFKIARHTEDIFGKLLASGITGLIAIQVFINISAISGILPLTGIPLPFISYGGTNIAALLSSLGILYNIARK